MEKTSPVLKQSILGFNLLNEVSLRLWFKAKYDYFGNYFDFKKHA